jgi:hypothetical protein
MYMTDEEHSEVHWKRKRNSWREMWKLIFGARFHVNVSNVADYVQAQNVNKFKFLTMDSLFLSDIVSNGTNIIGCMSPAVVSAELNTMNAASGSTKKLNSIPDLILPTPVKKSIITQSTYITC